MQRRTPRIAAGLFSGLLLFAGLSAAAVHAVDTNVGERITLSPVEKHYKLSAGEVKTDFVKIINDGTEPYTFTVYARPYFVKTEDYTPDFTSEAPNADVYQWIQFEKSSYRLRPGKSVEVPYTIRVPNDTAPGGHYGVIFAETQPQGESEGNAVVRKKRVGAIVYATVKGTFKTEGSAETANIPFFQTRPPLSTSQRITNSGNSDFDAVSTINVYDAFGGKKYQETKTFTILPDTVRKLQMNWENAAWFGLYRAEVTTKYLNKTMTETGYVLMAPIWVYAVVVLALGARVWYGFTYNRTQKDAEETAKQK